MKTLAAALLVASAITLPTFAAEDHAPKHGGVVVETKAGDLELVAKPELIVIHVSDHGKPMKLSSASFAYGFSMSLVYSDDARLTSGGSSNSEYRTTSAAASEGQTSPPDYTADSSTLAIQTDAAKKITAVSGAVDLAHHSVQGQNYVISSASLAATPTFDALNTAYNAGTPVSIQNNSDPSVAASALGLVNETGLATGSVKRHIILRNLDSNTGTVAYQLITVTIIPPT